MNKVFYLPDQGNHITAYDVERGILRITTRAKSFFPATDAQVRVHYNGQSLLVKFMKGTGGSDLLHMGKELFTHLAITPGCKLKITRTTLGEFIIEHRISGFTYKETDNIKKSQLEYLKAKYWEFLETYPFPKPPADGHSIDMIKYFKRTVANEVCQIGPYSGISVFEAANRIASDLVIINGVLQLLKDGKEPADAVITVRLGNKHVKDRGDFTINDKEGEAFNVASSFYNGKLSYTNRKWLGKELRYILVNAEVAGDIVGIDEDSPTEIIKVKDWDIK